MRLRNNSQNRRIVVYSIGKSSDELKNLGSYGYSYDLLKRSFLPLLSDCGEVVEINRPESRLEFAIERAKSEAKEPVVVGFAPFQNMHPTKSAPTVLYMCWEFPDIPNEPINHDPRFAWLRRSQLASLIVVPTHFVKDALERAGVETPVCVVPTPMPWQQFEIPMWDAEQAPVDDCPGHLMNRVSDGDPTATSPPSHSNSSDVSLTKRTYRWCRQKYKQMGREWMPPKVDRWLKAFIENRLARRRDALASSLLDSDPPATHQECVPLSGVVFTMILNPNDARKNWADLMTAFVHALRDQDDATLVLKFSTNERLAGGWVQEVRRQYSLLGKIKHRCKVVLITKSLTGEQMRSLTRATTFYANATRAEGACLPIMEAMAAGRPGLSPIHTAMTDYFDAKVGLVIDSSPEPVSWPGDATQQYSTTWARLSWQSLAEQISAAYKLAKNPAAYRKLSQAARDRLHAYANPDAVREKLEAALESVQPTLVESQLAGSRLAG